MNPLDGIDVRVLGALVEKELSTPDYYPLSLNALVHACNQSSNREPVMQLDEGAVVAGIDRLRRQSFVRSMQTIGSRVSKYSHLMVESMDLDQRERAVMCLLMLRGPQTVGELKGRSGRLAEFESLAAVESTLSALSVREAGPLVQRLARQPGQKEVRYAHTLSGEVTFDAPDAPLPAAGAAGDRIAAVEAGIAELRQELVDVRRQLESFRKQFE